MVQAEKTVPETLNGARLDRAVAELHQLSRAQVRRAIESGAVRVNGRKRPKGALVSAGEILAVENLDDYGVGSAKATPDAPLTVRLENADVIVVDKPAGQACAPLRASETGTLANALAGRYPELAGLGYNPREPGLVHRVDTDTSGLVLVARNQRAFDVLSGALKAERIRKGYLLLCSEAGLPDSGTIEFPLSNHPKDQRRVLACIHPRDVARNQPRPAVTRYRVLERRQGWALVEVDCARALRHQIRAHFAAIEHPLAGDALYGGPTVPGLTRHALHASRIGYVGGSIHFDVQSPLPADLASVLEHGFVPEAASEASAPAELAATAPAEVAVSPAEPSGLVDASSPGVSDDVPSSEDDGDDPVETGDNT